MNTNSTKDPSKIIQLNVAATSGYTHARNLTEKSAKKASELLTLNHDMYHTRFNGGFHNHLTHHILALWSLGASPEEMENMWEFNKAYQSPLEDPKTPSLNTLDLKNPVVFNECLGKDECYANFLRFFESEISEKGAPAVVKEYVLKGDDRANDIFSRLYTDLVHPMIHLGYAIEFKQPSLVAEALSAACVHDNWPKDFLLPAEEYARSHSEIQSKSLLDVFDDLRHDPDISSAVKDTDPFNKVRDGLLRRVNGSQLSPFLSQFQVEPNPEDLKRKMSEMMYTCAFATGAAQRPEKRETLDFVLIHNVTLAVFYPAILAQDWLTNEEKARLIEAKGRVDAVLYASCLCPELYPQRITDYKPRRPQDGWDELFHRSNLYYDEGHVAKVMRALFSLEQLPETPAGFPISQKDVIKIGHMAVDSVENALEESGHKMPKQVSEAISSQVGQGGDMVVSNMTRWVFYGGLSKAWDFIPELAIHNHE